MELHRHPPAEQPGRLGQAETFLEFDRHHHTAGFLVDLGIADPDPRAAGNLEAFGRQGVEVVGVLPRDQPAQRRSQVDLLGPFPLGQGPEFGIEPLSAGCDEAGLVHGRKRCAQFAMGQGQPGPQLPEARLAAEDPQTLALQGV